MVRQEVYRPIHIKNKRDQEGLPSSGGIFVPSRKPQDLEFQTQERAQGFKANSLIIRLERKHNRPMGDLLNDLYHDKEMNQTEIASYLEDIKSQSTVSNWMRLFGVSPRSGGESQKLAYRHPEKVKRRKEKKLRDRSEALGTESAEEQKEILENTYFEEGKLEKVSLRFKRQGFNVGPARVGRWFKELGAKCTASQEVIDARRKVNKLGPRLKKDRQEVVGKSRANGDFDILLTPREREVLIARYEGNGTLEEIGRDHGLTREAIRQIEERGLRRLSRLDIKVKKRGRPGKRILYEIA